MCVRRWNSLFNAQVGSLLATIFVYYSIFGFVPATDCQVLVLAKSKSAYFVLLYVPNTQKNTVRYTA